MASPSVLPGQPLYEPSSSTSSASIAPGKGAFERNGTIYSSSIGNAIRDGGMMRVQGKEETASVPETGNTVLGTVTRLTRLQAVLNIISVDGKPCQQDWQGIIRLNDIRSTGADKLKIWDCFRPGDVVRASVISLGDVRSYYLSTAKSDLGVVFAKHTESGNRLTPISWTEMQDPITGLVEPRKVAGPPEASA
ncbi:CND01650-like protein [Cystobasidium minutum MCA 4210]|uniref:CND01650-like protein n=1 Tax=Cystobasidium minutum MCA 4210 TaxID=1397322 RepID=UPI0034CFD396|eukprot:jgi/Rhomi1/57587/CE57586_215